MNQVIPVGLQVAIGPTKALSDDHHNQMARALPDAVRYVTTRLARRVAWLSAFALVPKAKLVYKMTNDICTSKYTGQYARDAARWAAQTEDIMYNMQFTDIGVQWTNYSKYRTEYKRRQRPGWDQSKWD